MILSTRPLGLCPQTFGVQADVYIFSFHRHARHAADRSKARAEIRTRKLLVGRGNGLLDPPAVLRNADWYVCARSES
jgi:hypothetical protein